jgi:DNA-directed RNA polymerase specialized sigma subunit|tara:strand:- start:284 stop:481 length:198 start_codon:yes stop_codon:yes gene_type:complete
MNGEHQEEDRDWIDYPEDKNSVKVAVKKHGAMTLEEVAKRLGISLVRVSQIEKQALKKLSKRIKL